MRFAFDMKRATLDISLLREVAGAREEIKARVAKASGVSESDLIVLVAIDMHVDIEIATDLMSDLGIADREIGEAVERLLARGYLELGGDQAEPGRPVLGVTRLGEETSRSVTALAISKRWNDLPFRQGDIVISSVPKTGTTWIQMICALLIFQTPDLPAPLPELSLWPDHNAVGREDLFARLAAQGHRRFVKTHTALGLLPVNPLLIYIIPTRHPLDAALSFYYHQRFGKEAPKGDTPESPSNREIEPHEALLHWIDPLSGPTDIRNAYTLPMMMRHLSAAWARRDEPNVVLVRYEDLSADLEGQMRQLAARLGITVPEAVWPRLVAAATFEQMRAAADRLQPLDDLADPKAFFRSGRSGAGRELLTSAELARYYKTAARLAPADLLDWLHRERKVV